VGIFFTIMQISNHAPEIEYYKSANDYLGEEDLIETDIYVIGLEGKFRVRALTFEQMTTITQKATTKEGKIDSGLFAVYTWLEGVVRPPFNEEQALKLYRKNGEIVREVSDNIWGMGRVSKRTFDTYLAELENAAKLAAQNPE
jgi:hypothetical protein